MSNRAASENKVVPFFDPGAYRAPAGFNVVALIAAYNEEDIIGATLEHLVRQGVRAYLIDHCSTDDTVAEAKRFLGRNLLGIERFPEESGFSDSDRAVFHWSAILKRKEQLALELPADWFLHNDADELRESPWPGMRLCDALHLVQSCGFNAVDFKVLNFPPTQDGFKKGDDLSKSFTWFEWGAAYDTLQVKGWRNSGPVDLASTGGHDANFPSRRVFPLRFPLRHYPIRSQAQGERKVFQDRRPRFVEHERKRDWHVQYDEVKAGTSFLRDPASLKPFDLDRVRVELALQSRDVEAQAREAQRALQAERARVAAEHARALEALRQSAEAQARALHRQLNAVEQDAQRAAELAAEQHRAAVDALEQRADAVEAQLQHVREQLQHVRAQLQQLEASYREREADIAALTGSWSWKVTAPLRAGLKRLRGY
jgi:chemotaxis protein histidine kinase CheA